MSFGCGSGCRLQGLVAQASVKQGLAADPNVGHLTTDYILACLVYFLASSTPHALSSLQCQENKKVTKTFDLLPGSTRSPSSVVFACLGDGFRVWELGQATRKIVASRSGWSLAILLLFLPILVSPNRDAGTKKTHPCHVLRLVACRISNLPMGPEAKALCWGDSSESGATARWEIGLFVEALAIKSLYVAGMSVQRC